MIMFNFLSTIILVIIIDLVGITLNFRIFDNFTVCINFKINGD